MKDKKQRSAILLCGGMSRRMGEDKGSMEINKKPMISYVLEALISQIDEVIIVLNNNERIAKYKSLIQGYSDYNNINNKDSDSYNNYFDFDIIFIEDEIKNKGPLSGIMTGLKTMSNDYGLVLPCDTPYINSDFVSYMFDTLNSLRKSNINNNIGGIIPYHTNGENTFKKMNLNNTEPLHSIFNKKSFSIIEKLLKSDENRVKSFIAMLSNCYFIPIANGSIDGMNTENSDSNNKIDKINFKNINYKDDL